MANVKSLKVTYNALNEQNIFTNGDGISGQVHLEVTKECHIDALLVKFKGKAEVKWTETEKKKTVVYYSKEKYFSVKGYFIRDKDFRGGDKQTFLMNQNGETYSNVVPAGCHVYPFTFQFPFQNISSSFRSHTGKIVYTLEARLKRSMRMDMTHSMNLNFVSKEDLNSDRSLMTPQHESKDKKMNIFSSGSVAMDVNLEKSGFFQGEGLKILAGIQNNSSREIKPKYCIYRKYSFFARGKRRVETKDVLKEVGDPIRPSTNETITRVITIPHDSTPSILNCSIIKVEYRLRVYLDVKFALDPKLKFPIVILPAVLRPEERGGPSAPTYEFGAFANTYMPGETSFLQNPTSSGPSAPPPSYETSGMYPSISNYEKF